MSLKQMGIAGSIFGIIVGCSFLFLSVVGGAILSKSIMYAFGSLITLIGFYFSDKQRSTSAVMLIVGMVLLFVSIPIAFISNIIIGFS